MLSTTNSRLTNFIAMILMLTGIGGLQAWPLPTHCLHPLEKLPPLQRAFRQCVEHVQAMWSALPGHLLACLVPTDCLRSLGNWPSFHRAFRQSVGSPEAMASLKGAGADKIMNEPAFERTWGNMSEFGGAGNSARVVHDLFCDLTSYAKDAEMTMLIGASYPSTSLQLSLRGSSGKVYTGRQIYLAGIEHQMGRNVRPLSAKMAALCTNRSISIKQKTADITTSGRVILPRHKYAAREAGPQTCAS